MKDINQILDSWRTEDQKQSAESQRPELDETEGMRRADYLWDIMAGMYTSKWTKKNGEIASSLWIQALASHSKEEIRLGVRKCEEKIISGDQWPPDLAEFMAMIHGQSEVDYQAAFFRCLDKKPEGRIEQWVYENASYNIKRMSHDKAEKAHRKYMLEAEEREKRGSLMLNAEILARALPKKVDRNLNDIKRQELGGKKHKFSDRIAKIRAGKK